MSVATVRAHLEEFGWSGSILEFEESSATVELAAEQMGTEPRRIAKTLSFYNPADLSTAILIVAAGDAKVNNGKFKLRFGGKGNMLKAHDVLEHTGYPIGGVCPFANPETARVYLDASLKRFVTVFPAAGSANSTVELTIDELERFSGAVDWVDVTHGWQEDLTPQ